MTQYFQYEDRLSWQEPLLQSRRRRFSLLPNPEPPAKFSAVEREEIVAPLMQFARQRVVWRKAYCLSKVEAVEEAERFHHAAKHALAGILRRQRERQLNITHWSEQLSHRALQHVTKALGRNPANEAAELMKTLLHSRNAKEADQVADCHRIGFIQRGTRHRFTRGMIVQQRAL